MDNVANHANVSLTSTAAVSAGDAIAIKSALIADLASLATAVAAGSPAATAVTESAELQSSVSGTRWNGNHTVEHSITFASNDNLRFFFNAGGKMRMKFTRNGNAGGSATAKDSSVDELITAIGNFDLKSATSTRSGTGETETTNGLANGIADLSSTYVTLLTLTQASGSYSGNMSVKVEAKINNTDYSDATVVTMKYTLDDAESGGVVGTGLDFTYTSGNLSGIDQYANFIGITDFALHIVEPTTAQGLASVSTIASSAVVSNNNGV